MAFEFAADLVCSNTRTCKGIHGSVRWSAITSALAAGNGGRTLFYQSEASYDVPNQGAWMNGGVNGFASCKVGNGVTTHAASGLGVYCYFSTNGGVKLNSAIEAPTAAGVQLRNMLSLSLGGVGEITHVLNSRGGAANGASNSAHLAQ